MKAKKGYGSIDQTCMKLITSQSIPEMVHG
jgi:hypothetical protein